MFYVLLYVTLCLDGERELVALLGLSSLCLVKVERLFLAVPRGCLQFVIVIFRDHTHLLLLTSSHTDQPKPIKAHSYLSRCALVASARLADRHIQQLNESLR